MGGDRTIPDDALQSYFDGLLQDASVAPAGQFADALELPLQQRANGGNVAALADVRSVRLSPVRPYAEPLRTLNLRPPLPALVSEPAAVTAPIALREPVGIPPAPLPKVEPAPLVEPAPPPAAAEQPAVDNLAAMAEPADWAANGRPRWAQQPFECLMFKAGGLLLAAPLVELGSIFLLPESGLSAIFAQSEWFMGLLPVKEYNVRAVDTALIVMPERYQPAMRDSYRYLITLFGSDWGLAVDAVVSTVLLDPDAVRWRGGRSKRPWLAGTLTTEMCALFDIGQLAWMLHNQDRRRAPV